MKRKILILIFVICLLGITGCGKKGEYIPKGDKLTLTLEDEGFGTTTFNYYSDDGYEIVTNKNGRKMSVTITCKEDNFRLQLYHMDGYYKDYEELRNDLFSSRVAEEFTWNGFQGIAYNRLDYDEEDILNFKIFLASDKGTTKLLYGLFEYLESDDKEIIELFRSDKVQKMLSTIVFKEASE